MQIKMTHISILHPWSGESDHHSLTRMALLGLVRQPCKTHGGLRLSKQRP